MFTDKDTIDRLRESLGEFNYETIEELEQKLAEVYQPISLFRGGDGRLFLKPADPHAIAFDSEEGIIPYTGLNKDLKPASRSTNLSTRLGPSYSPAGNFSEKPDVNDMADSSMNLRESFSQVMDLEGVVYLDQIEINPLSKQPYFDPQKERLVAFQSQGVVGRVMDISLHEWYASAQKSQAQGNAFDTWVFKVPENQLNSFIQVFSPKAMEGKVKYVFPDLDVSFLILN